MAKENGKKFTIPKRIIAIAAAVLVGIIVIANCLVIVQPGHTGVVVTLGKVNDNVMQEGIHLKIPFVQDVVQISNRIVKLEVDTEAFSSDLQTVSTTLAINYRVDTQMSHSLYKNVGASYEDVLMVPAVNEVLKASTAKFTAEESVTNRSIISEELIEGLNDKLNKDGLYVTDVNIINFDFSEAFINAIEEKQVAQQQLLKAETEKQTAITNAEAEAEAVRIKAEAQAAANKVLAASLSELILENKMLEKWNGELPMVTGDADPFISLDNLTGDDKEP